MIHPCPNCGMVTPIGPSCANHSCVVTTEVTSVATGTIGWPLSPSQITVVCDNCSKLRAALSQAQRYENSLQNIRAWAGTKPMPAHTKLKWIREEVEDALTAEAALPSDTPGAQAQEEELCAQCGKLKNDSTMHHDAPGTNWGAALHWFQVKEK